MMYGVECLAVIKNGERKLHTTEICKLRCEKDITDDRSWKAKSRQNKTEMARPGERGYGKKETR